MAYAATRRARPVHGDLRAEGARVPRRSAGFTLLEITIVMVILMIAIGALSGTVVSSSRLSETNRESALAYEAARGVAEQLQGDQFSQLFARYNQDPGDDPGGAGTAPGNAFDVRGLTPRPGDPDGRVGTIVLPTVATTPPSEALREDVVMPALGMPRDLNGDGSIDGFDHSSDYMLLPATIRIEWTGTNGDRELSFDLLLVD